MVSLPPGELLDGDQDTTEGPEDDLPVDSADSFRWSVPTRQSRSKSRNRCGDVCYDARVADKALSRVLLLETFGFLRGLVAWDGSCETLSKPHQVGPGDPCEPVLPVEPVMPVGPDLPGRWARGAGTRGTVEPVY